ncbi:hypothetical protein [Halorussus halophilus]|uniref:hypothetical protein n=1 Tax=Halorussus halophilus TaxID=2650975 RepID=UPI0017883BE0|nr:hypothetical protein [Halorussus halophilus]
MRAEQITFLAGSIAYHALVSLLPLLVLLVTVASTVGGTAETAVISFAGALLTPEAGGAFVSRLKSATTSRGVSIRGRRFPTPCGSETQTSSVLLLDR